MGLTSPPDLDQTVNFPLTDFIVPRPQKRFAASSRTALYSYIGKTCAIQNPLDFMGSSAPDNLTMGYYFDIDTPEMS